MSEMRRPQDYFRSLYISSAFVNSAYLSLAMVMYAYAGKWVTSPSLGSAGSYHQAGRLRRRAAGSRGRGHDLRARAGQDALCARAAQ